MQDFEKLGAFYLGKTYDLDARRRGEELVLYDSRDLVTHGVCVGMTGSGKTGLCIAIIEEAAIDGVPSIVIDPKGDLSNLLLTFPQLRPEDFAPWVNSDDARRKELDPAAYAAKQAETWKKGLAEWGQDAARIQRLRDAADFTIYTPGSSAGTPVSVLKSFSPPPPEIADDSELMQERVATTATSLLGLVGIDADPLQSREHILIATILGQAWAKGESLDLPAMIHRIQEPPVERIGVMEVETFYPAKERFALAMQLNNLVASPGFARWMEGDALDVGSLLHTPAGKPRVSIFSIAHLNDAERMFFVSMLFNEVLAWVRTQSGTTSLRALVYMDEIAGYFPPVANPPSKQPLLILMKQARAFGVGLLLATQNPVDIDYKGLANAGTWFIGRLQTERDKMRVLDGLEGAAAGASAKFDRSRIEQMLSQLGSRVFLMNNVHEDAPEVFEVRWVLSYLCGPLTRNQIRQLAQSAEPARTAMPAEAEPAPVAAAPVMQAARGAASQRPILPPGIQQSFAPVGAKAAPESLQYRPMLFAQASVYYADAKLGIAQEEDVACLVPLGGRSVVDWEAARETNLLAEDLEDDPAEGAAFASLPAEAGKEKSYSVWQKGFADLLYRSRSLSLFKHATTKLTSRPGESERDFRLRVSQACREARDAQAEKLRAKYAPKLSVLQERLRRAQQALAVQEQQASQAKLSTFAQVGSAILSAFLGRKVASAGNVGRASTAVRGVGRSMKESGDVRRAAEDIDAVRGQINELEQQFERELDEIEGKVDPATAELETLEVRPKKANIQVKACRLCWAPYILKDGTQTPAWL